MAFNWGHPKDVSLDVSLCLLYGNKSPQERELRSRRVELIGLEGSETLLAKRKEA